MIKNNVFLSFLIFFFLPGVSIVICRSQPSDNHLFSLPGSEIIVDYLPGNDIYYIHIMDEGTTVYSLARFFQIPLDEVMKTNQLHQGFSIKKGQAVRIPFKNNLISTYNKKNACKIFYQVKKKETLYHISKVFQRDIPTLLQLNNKNTPELNEGEFLLIGYLSVNDNPLHIENNDSIITENETDISVYYLNDVIGYWDRKNSSHQLFVLHNDAKIGSLMDIYNPMLQRHTKAKVIGRIPAGTYFSDIDIILSPQCAKILGILDARFKVNIKHEK